MSKRQMKEPQGPYGGAGGYIFSDQMISDHGNITKIIVKAGQVCDGIQFTYGDIDAPYQGGSGGSKYEAKLKPNERITDVSGYYDQTYIRQLTFTTTHKTYGPWGKLKHQNGGQPFKASGHSLRFISGFAVPKLQGLTFYFEKEKEEGQMKMTL